MKARRKPRKHHYGAHDVSSSQLIVNLGIPLVITGAIFYYSARAVVKRTK